MTTIQTATSPDQLVQEAQEAGLCCRRQPPEQRLRQRQLRAQRVDQLFSAMDRMGAVDEPAIMSPESQVAEEIAAMRAERRASSPS